jgi:hypothetical protein
MTYLLHLKAPTPRDLWKAVSKILLRVSQTVQYSKDTASQGYGNME